MRPKQTSRMQVYHKDRRIGLRIHGSPLPAILLKTASRNRVLIHG